MKVLQINSLGGIKNQLYDPTQTICAPKPIGIVNGTFDINSLFWSQIFEQQRVKDLIQRAILELPQDANPKVQAILGAPDRFFALYKKALLALDSVWSGFSEEKLFCALETLEMVCLLYSRLESAPFHLTISEGYVLSKYSALDMAQTCLLPFCNPYLPFITQMVLPAILEYSPDILILSGAVNLASFAIAKYLRNARPGIFIIAANNETDYFSFKKISKLLVRNTALFSVYHCLVLQNSKSIKTLFEQLDKGITRTNLDNISNLIYSLDGGTTIIRTTDSEPTAPHIPTKTLSGNNVCNLKIFPRNRCFWNRCSFCGINSKYNQSQCVEWDIQEAVSTFEQLYSRGITRIWLLDEAIPPHILKCLCEEILVRNIKIEWHMRTRIDPSLTVLAELLYASGVRHIIFGLESASKRVLNLMEKINDDFDYLDVAEQIVKEYTATGIQVHFSTILGFPTESKAERDETTLFLDFLKRSYPHFSYNINTFYLDIGSKIYRRWEDYDIVGLSFPCSPKYYLENYLDWTAAISSSRGEELEADRYTAFARQYDWYPEGALIDPDVFYSFWEYGRFAILKEKINQQQKLPTFNKSKKIKFNFNVCFRSVRSDLWLMYQLENHHFIVGGSLLKTLMDAADTQKDFESVLNQYPSTFREAAKEVILQLYSKGFFV